MSNYKKSKIRALSYEIGKVLESKGIDSLTATPTEIGNASRTVFSQYSGKYSTKSDRAKARDIFKEIQSSVMDNSANWQVERKFLGNAVSERVEILHSSEQGPGEVEENVYWQMVDLVLQNPGKVYSVMGVPVKGNTPQERQTNAMYLARSAVAKMNDENSSARDSGGEVKYFVAVLKNGQITMQ
jgi:hypothetical protein